MPMIVSINQPAYLPWLGYFHRIAASDLHIVLDHVQFEKNSFTNRNKVATANGPVWLTVPVKTSGRFAHLSIDTLEIDNTTNWRKRHHLTIEQNYSKCPFFRAHAPFFEGLYQREWFLLRDLCRETTEYLLKGFGITTPLRYSSQMHSTGSKSDLVLGLCKEVNADAYLSGTLGRQYMKVEEFEAAGVCVAFQDYCHPEYRQLHAPFISHLSALDLLLNCGPNSLEILMKGQDTSAVGKNVDSPANRTCC
jgi:hypothetical protein